MSEIKDFKMTLLALEYMKWAYPKKSDATGDASTAGFLQLLATCKREIVSLYPKIVRDTDLPE